eukprot:1085940_1
MNVIAWNDGIQWRRILWITFGISEKLCHGKREDYVWMTGYGSSLHSIYVVFIWVDACVVHWMPSIMVSMAYVMHNDDEGTTKRRAWTAKEEPLPKEQATVAKEEPLPKEEEA